MKIRHMPLEPTPQPKRPGAAAPAGRAGADAAIGRRPTADRVDVSSLAAELSSVLGELASDLPASADPARIEALRQAIRDGRSPVDVRALAQAILDEELGR